MQVNLKSHFAQPNSIEFKPAVQWKHLQLVIADCKAQQRKEHTEQLKLLMLDYVKVGLPLACEAICRAWSAILGWVTLSTDAGGEGPLQDLLTGICGWPLLTPMHYPHHRRMGGDLHIGPA